MTPLRAVRRREMAGAAALVAVALLTPSRAHSQQGPFEPWVGEMGITETVSEIMSREARARPWTSHEGLQILPRREFNRVGLRQDPQAPAVPRWPWDPSELYPLPTVGLGHSHGGGPRAPQIMGTSFIGPQLYESGYVPPDTTGAVGPTQILMFANGRVKVYSKIGAVDGLSVSANSFFGSVRNGSDASGPQVKYDAISQRWIVTAINGAASSNRILIAVSGGPTITNASSFTFYYFQQDAVAPAGNAGQFADHPKSGVDASALYVGCNMYGASFTGTTGWVVRKSSILGGGPIVATAFRNLALSGGNGPYAPMGVDNDDPGATEGYFVGVDTSLYGRLVLRRVSNPGGAPSISANLNVTVPTTVAPQVQPALGSIAPLDGMDDRLSYCSIHLNRATGARTLWTAHQIEVNAGGVASSTGNRNGARWYELQDLTTTPSLRQSGTLFDGAATNPRGFWFPAVAMTGQGHMALGSSMAGGADRAQIATAGRLASDVLGTIRAPAIVQTSVTAYNVQAGVQRWGDYSQAWVDPTDDQTVWIFQEYCNATDSWATRAIKLLAPPPVTPAVCAPAMLSPGDTNVNVTVSGASVNGSAFYDTQPGKNRLAALVSGGNVTVNSVTFSHATPAQFVMNVTVGVGAPLGVRNVTATNPDGQQATGAGVLTIQAAGSCPTFTTQPTPQTACVGGSATFTAAANGAPAPTYQWRRNGQNLADGGAVTGALTSTLMINPVSSNDAAGYDCVAANGCAGGPTTSNSVGLTVNDVANISGQPANASGFVGESRSFSVTASGAGPIAYQWRKNGVNLADGGSVQGALTPTLTINPLALTDGDTYDCVVTNPCGNVPTSGALLEVFCNADINQDGFIDPLDYNQFINWFEAGDLRADYNHDGFLDPLDYNWFINGFEGDGGC